MSDGEGMRDLAFFSRFLPGDVDAFLAAAPPRSVPPGYQFLQMGSENTRLWVICKGAVLVSRRVGEEDVPLATLRPGQTFGELSIMAGGLSSATLTTEEETEVLEIDRAELDRLFASHPSLAASFWHTVALDLRARLLNTNELVANYVDVNRALVEDPDFRAYYSRL